jgi:hypothetical protein
MELGVGKVALVGMRTVSGEDLVVLAQTISVGRAVLAKMVLNGGLPIPGWLELVIGGGRQRPMNTAPWRGGCPGRR